MIIIDVTNTHFWGFSMLAKINAYEAHIRPSGPNPDRDYISPAPKADTFLK